MASEKIINQKKEEVSKLAEKIKEAKIVLLTDYRGINVEDVTNLRTELRNAKAEYKVIKNNITKAIRANFADVKSIEKTAGRILLKHIAFSFLFLNIFTNLYNKKHRRQHNIKNSNFNTKVEFKASFIIILIV